MDIKAAIISQNGHRINEYIADMAEKALADTDITTIRGYDPIVDIVIMTNGVGINDEAMTAYMSDKPIIYLHDELQSSLVPKDDVWVYSQYHGHGYGIFPVSKLSLFDSRWDKNQQITKYYDFVYWGHKKAGRENLYATFPDDFSSLYIGEWVDDFKASHHVNYIRDRDVLLNTIGMGRYTDIGGSDYDHKYGNQPLRIYEALMMGVIPQSKGRYYFSTYEEALDYFVGDVKEARKELTTNLKEIIYEHSR